MKELSRKRDNLERKAKESGRRRLAYWISRTKVVCNTIDQAVAGSDSHATTALFLLFPGTEEPGPRLAAWDVSGGLLLLKSEQDVQEDEYSRARRPGGVQEEHSLVSP